MSMLLHALGDDFARLHVEGSEERRRAVPFVVVRPRASPAPLHREARLGPLKGLDLALLIDAEDDRLLRRVQVKPDNISKLAEELRVGGDLEGLLPMRFQSVRSPDAMNLGMTEPDHGSQGSCAPVG